MYFFEELGHGQNYIATISAIFVVFNTYFLIFKCDLFLWKIHYSIPYEIRSACSLLKWRVKPIYKSR